MIVSRRIRLYPTIEQEQKMVQSAGVARFIYNWTIENCKLNDLSRPNDGDLRKEITRLKKSKLSWLGDVSNDIPKQSVKDACATYNKFLNGKINNPKFKSKKSSKPSFYNDPICLKATHNHVRLQKIGWVKIKKDQIPISPHKYYNPRVSYDGKYWYLSIGLDQEQAHVELTDESIGIDVGVKDLAICSNGMIFKNINKTKAVKKLEKKLRRLQRKVSKKYHKNKKGKEYVKTSNIIKLEIQIKLLMRRLTNIRTNHLHQSTSMIVKTKPSRIVMETLNIRGMMKNRYLAKAIAKQCLYEFKRQLRYKCEWIGIEFVEADRWFPSSKLCSECGHKKEKLSLSERTYICKECGLVIDRDYNASINLSRYGLV